MTHDTRPNEPVFDGGTETVDAVSQAAMALGGLAFLVGLIGYPPLMALGLLVWGLYALYELATSRGDERVESAAGSQTH